MRAGRVIVGAVLTGIVACRGATPESGAGSADGRGAPPENHDTAAAPVNRNPSPASGTIPAPPRVTLHEVNTGPHGMIAQVRWLLSPDQHAILVVEDPVGVEAEPVPDGFLFANEATGVVAQVNGVWDVAPSPDWSRLAIGRAFVFRSGPTEAIPDREWPRFFAWLPADVRMSNSAATRRYVEPYTFLASGMSYARAIGLTTIADVATLPPGSVTKLDGPTVRLEGWRVRWTPSGDTLAIGSAPARAHDDAEPVRWTLVGTRDIRSYRDSLGGAPAGVRLMHPQWVTGPTLDVSVEHDLNLPRRVPVAGGAVTSANGRIRLEQGGATVDLGEGAALAATRNARFIVALVPNANAKEFDPKTRVAVYELAR